MGIFRRKKGKGWGDIDPQRTRSYFWRFTPMCPIWWKSTKKCKCDRESEHILRDRQTDSQTQTDFITCPMLYALAMGQITSVHQVTFVMYVNKIAYIIGDFIKKLINRSSSRRRRRRWWLWPRYWRYGTILASYRWRSWRHCRWYLQHRSRELIWDERCTPTKLHFGYR